MSFIHDMFPRSPLTMFPKPLQDTYSLSHGSKQNLKSRATISTSTSSQINLEQNGWTRKETSPVPPME